MQQTSSLCILPTEQSKCMQDFSHMLGFFNAMNNVFPLSGDLMSLMYFFGKSPAVIIYPSGLSSARHKQLTPKPNSLRLKWAQEYLRCRPALTRVRQSTQHLSIRISLCSVRWKAHADLHDLVFGRSSVSWKNSWLSVYRSVHSWKPSQIVFSAVMFLKKQVRSCRSQDEFFWRSEQFAKWLICCHSKWWQEDISGCETHSIIVGRYIHFWILSLDGIGWQ